MFLLGWLTTLLSLPFGWAGYLAMMFKQPLAVPLLTTAWRINGRGETAVNALVAVQRLLGSEAARARASAWLSARPRPEIAGFAGLLALDAGDLEGARRLLEIGSRLGRDKRGMLELLAFYVAQRSQDHGAWMALCRDFEHRNDLPGDLSRMVHVELLWDEMLNGQHDSARRRAEHILEIEDSPQAHMALWALCESGGDQRGAERHLAQAGPQSPAKTTYRLLGEVAIGQIEQAKATLGELQQIDESLAQKARSVIERKEARP